MPLDLVPVPAHLQARRARPRLRILNRRFQMIGDREMILRHLRHLREHPLHLEAHLQPRQIGMRGLNREDGIELLARLGGPGALGNE